jgi:predicted dehydrogenase
MTATAVKAGRLKFLVVGCGSIGQRHIRNLNAIGAGEVIACEPVPAKAEKVRCELNAPVYASMGDALAQRPDAVLICTPSAYHLSQARAALDVGCDIFVEKPIAHILDGLDEFCHQAETAGAITMVGYNWRFHPQFLRMKEMLQEGAIGKIHSARVNCGQYLPDWHPWEDYRQMYSARRALGGGILLDSHELDYITWFLGDVDRVTGVASKISDLEIETEDTADIILTFRSGAQASVHLDYLQRPAQRSYEFYGAEGTLRWSRDGDLSVYRASAGEWQQFSLPNEFDINSTYIDELQHFIDCVRSRKSACVDARRAKYVLELIVPLSVGPCGRVASTSGLR